jgi:hypothetical protein
MVMMMILGKKAWQGGGRAGGESWRRVELDLSSHCPNCW